MVFSVPNNNNSGQIKIWVRNNNDQISDVATITVNTIFVCHHIYGSYDKRDGGLSAYKGKLGYWYDTYCNRCGYKLRRWHKH